LTYTRKEGRAGRLLNPASIKGRNNFPKPSPVEVVKQKTSNVLNKRKHALGEKGRERER